MKAKRILASVLSVALLLQLSPLGVLALDESLPQTPQVSTVQENLDPAPTEEPALVEEPVPTAEPAPTAAPTPEPTAEPTAAPAPEETPAPDAAAAPAPEPSAEPTAAPDPAAEVQAMIDALPDEVTEDNAEAVEQALTDIDDAKESLTDDELAGLDLTRYDAAANALLALWDEAPADAVETLDNYPEPTKEGEWYVIDSVDDLKWLATASRNVQAKLTADIKLNGDNKVLDGKGDLIANPDNLQKWTPIGTNTDPFTGTFDGGGYTISGLYIDGNTNNVGLFGCIGTNGTATGTVKNVTLADSYVRGNEFVSGICGWNKGGTLQDCHNTGTVSGTTNVGGVCGKNDSGTVDGCYNSGTVSAGFFVGGVCGINNNGSTLKNSYNTGKVSCTNEDVGGVCGWNDASTVQGCYSTGTVSGTTNVGGVCGMNSGKGTVQECYNTVTVSGTRNVGGVCGMNSGRRTVQGCYNTGKVSGNSYFGGVCGFSDGSYVNVEKCYYLVGTSENAVGNIGDDINCESKTETEFKNGAVAYRLQSDLNITTQVWGQRIGMDKTPVLSSDTKYKVYKTAAGSPCPGYSNTQGETRNHNYVNGVCSNCGEWEEAKDVDGYYEIYNQGQLRWFANLVNTTSDSNTKLNARLINDITMDGTEWTPIGKETNPFTGTFDGGKFTITGLKCTDKNAEYVGLVGYAVSATIQNVTVKDSSLNGKQYIGAVCGYIKGGTITNCHAVGTTIGDSERDDSQYWGGIVGYMTGNTKVTNCTNSGTVSGGWYLGGIAGYAGTNTTVQRCFNSGAVTGRCAKFGGIVGQTYNATVQDCGNTGAVSEFTPYNGSQYGGIVGLAESESTIQNCYNADKNTAAKIGGNIGNYASNCYYLASDSGSSGSTDPDIIAKTADQFASGEVAYLLQGERTDTTTVWGQTLTGANKQNYPVLGGKTVYYNDELNYHNHDDNTECETCSHKPKTEVVEGKTWYIIKTPENLKWFAKWVNKGHTDANARLANEITLNENVLTDKGELNSTNHEQWTPIGTDTNPFTGTFDGGGFTISGLYFNDNTKDYVGLFGCIGKNGTATGTVQNVTIADSYVCGNEKVGGVCGYNKGGIVTECHNSGKVTGNDIQTGGVCGKNEGTLKNSSNTGMVTGNKYYTGGVCGQNYGGTVTGCTNTGTVTGNNISTGGVCGENNNGGKVEGSHNEGNVTGKSYTGGVCGNNVGSSVNGCTNTGAVTGTKQCIGGVCGQNLSNGTVNGSHNEGNVTSTDNNGQQVGGVCGYIESGTVNGCYNSGKVIGKYSYTGGVCGQNGSGTVQKSYNTGEVSGANSVGGVCGSCSFNSNNATVQESYNTGAVSGTNYVGGVCGKNQLKGNVNGCYNTANVSGTSFVGGVCGQNDGNVNGCYNTTGEGSGTGNVTGTNEYTGGVCGMNNGILENSYNTGTVFGKNYVGGVCGQNYTQGTVKVCYNTGNVTGNSKFGGVYGESRKIVRDCYYLSDTSGTSSKGCTPRTAVDFQCGKVAFELQKALGQHSPQVWGQNIGIDKAPVLSSDKYTVYPTKLDSPCKGGFSNTADETLKHNYKNGKCIYCGQPQIAYTVTIPASVELGSKPAEVTIAATGVTLPDDKQLNVKVADNSKFEVALVVNGKPVDPHEYKVTDVTNNNATKEVTPGNTVLTVESSETEKSVKLQFNTPDPTTYSGTYTGTVTYNVSVDDKS